MKNFYLLALMGIMLLMAACSDQYDLTDEEQELVGVWKMKSCDYTGTTTSTYMGETHVYSYGGEAYDISVEMNLKENGEMHTSGSYTVLFSYEIDGFDFEQEVSYGFFESGGTWSRSGNTLTMIESNGKTSTAEILFISESTLDLKIEGTQTQSQQGMVNVIEIIAYMSFEK